MNIFFTYTDPGDAAKYLPYPKPLIKMILESVQMVSAYAQIKHGLNTEYKLTHSNHPCNKWLRESDGNVLWLIRHTYAMGNVYAQHSGKRHKSLDVLDRLSRQLRLKDEDMTIPFLAIAGKNSARAESFDHACIEYRTYLQTKSYWK